jgi:hypothetical protein
MKDELLELVVAQFGDRVLPDEWNGLTEVESVVKQIDKRLQIVGAQWKSENLPRTLQLRCAYLNRQLAPSA